MDAGHGPLRLDQLADAGDDARACGLARHQALGLARQSRRRDGEYAANHQRSDPIGHAPAEGGRSEDAAERDEEACERGAAKGERRSDLDHVCEGSPLWLAALGPHAAAEPSLEDEY